MIMKEFLTHITRDKNLESKWLNTISLLEYVGARKISKTVCQTHPSEEILQHYADEVRHAHVFKKLSNSLTGAQNKEYLCGEEGMNYFQSLDQQASSWVASHLGTDPYFNYLFVTWLIERRAMKLYPLYRTVTSAPQVASELQKIIVEEASHMHPIEDKVKSMLSSDKLEELCGIEERLFAEFEANLTKSLQLKRNQ